MTRTSTLALAALAATCGTHIGVTAGAGCLAHQGPRQCRGRAPEPAHRLWPRGRPQRHRRHDQQFALHQAVADRDAGTAGRQHPRPDAAHRQRRGRHGDRQPAGLLDPGHAHRRDGLGARRRQEPARRHPAGDAAARRRRQRLCGRPGLARDRRVPGRRRRRQDRARRADGRPHLQRRHHRARDRLRAQPPQPGPPRVAQRRLHHRQAHRGRHQRLHRDADRRADRSLDACSSPCRSNSRATWSRC